MATTEIVINNFKIDTKKDYIGHGNFGHVYKGKRIIKIRNPFNKFDIPDIVAIKCITKEKLKKKCSEEINILLELNNQHNQHIVKLYDIAQNSKTIYLLMEYCPYGDLFSYIKKHSENNINNPLIGPWKGFNEYIVLYFLFQLTSAFESMKEINIFHRDLKPQNILLAYDKRLHPLPRDTFSNPTSYCLVHLPLLKLTDFDFAKVLPSEDLTASILGSPLYMAPEILSGKQYSNLTDLWSLGVILYQLAIFRLPYNATSIQKLRNIVTSNKTGYYFPGEEKNLDDNSSIDPNAFCSTLKELIRKLLIKNPNKRISYEEFFEIVNKQLKPQWESYRKVFYDILNEKEKELESNEDITFEYDENNSELHHFIPIPSNLQNILTKSKNYDSDLTYHSNNSSNSAQLNTMTDEKQSNKNSFDDSYWTIV